MGRKFKYLSGIISDEIFTHPIVVILVRISVRSNTGCQPKGSSHGESGNVSSVPQDRKQTYSKPTRLMNPRASSFVTFHRAGNWGVA